MNELLALFPSLAAVEPSVGATHAPLLPQSVAARTVLFEEHQACAGFPLLLEGEIQVSCRSSGGRSMQLYKIVPGDLCLVSCASIFRREPLAAYAVATRASRLVMVPTGVFYDWLRAPAFRDEILGLFADRMTALTSLIEAVAFHRLDQRLAASLLNRAAPIRTTHQALAEELGTVREIVTRLLRRFEDEGWIALSRESVRIVDEAGLRAFVDADLILRKQTPDVL